MTEPKRNRTNSDIDDRTERDCVARGEIAARNRGIIAVRWVDVMPRVEGPSLLRPGRSDERIREYYARQARQAAAAQTERVLVTKPEERERCNAAKKRRYHLGSEADRWIKENGGTHE